MCFYFKEGRKREKGERKREVVGCWITPQVVAAAGAGLSRSQGALMGFHLYAGTHLRPSFAAFSALSYDGSGAVAHLNVCPGRIRAVQVVATHFTTVPALRSGI